MNSATGRHAGSAYSQQILDELTRRQYLDPHRPLLDALGETAGVLGLPTEAARRIIEALRLDSRQPIGRLRRAELSALANDICSRVQNRSTPMD